MSEIWFRSDDHFGHYNLTIAGKNYCDRPFADVPTMTEGLIETWNEDIAPDDLVYYLGDFAMGDPHEHVPVARKLNGRKILVAGNHDRCWGSGKQPHKWVDFYLYHGFEAVVDRMFIEVHGTKVLLCHFPYRDYDAERHGAKYRDYAPDPGLYSMMPLIHGHIHGKRQLADDSHQLNVGIDAWDYRAVHIDHAAQLLGIT